MSGSFARVVSEGWIARVEMRASCCGGATKAGLICPVELPDVRSESSKFKAWESEIVRPKLKSRE